MKTIYVTRYQWRDQAMRAEPDRAAGGAGPRLRSRGMPAGEDKVVDLAAWKAENLMLPDEPEAGDLPASALEQYGGREPVRHRRGLAEALDWAELAATLAVTAAFAALVARVLLF